MPDTSLFPDAQPLGSDSSRPSMGDSALFPQDEQTTRLRSAVQGAKSPDTAARVLRMQTRTGAPVDFIERNLDEVERQAQASGFDAERFRRESPALASWLAANPKHAELAKDDIGNLSRIDRLLGAVQRGAYSLSQSGSGLAIGANVRAMREADEIDKRMAAGEQAGAIPDSLDAAGYRFMSPVQRSLYRNALGNSVSESTTNIVRRQGQIEGVPVDPTIAAALQSKSFADFWFHFSQKPVDFVLTVGAESLPQMAPALGLALVGGVAGGLPLAAGGAGAGSFGVDYAGSTLEALRDEGVDLKDRDAIAAAVSDKDLMTRVGRKAFSHAAPVAAFDAASAALAGLRLVPARQAAGVVAGRPSVGSAAVSAGRAGVDLGAQAVAQGTLGAAGEATGQLAQGKTELDAGQIMAEFFGEFAGAPAEVGGMAAAGVRRNLRETLRAKERQAFFEALGEGVGNSETFKRMPEKLREYIAQATRDGPVENVFVPVEAWTTFWQSQNVDPREAAAEIMGETTFYDDSLRTGADIRVPLADFATKIAPNAQAIAAFSPEIRLRADELNAREAAEIEEQLAKAAQASDEAPGATSAQKVREDIVGQLTGAGFDRGTVDAYASMFERAFGAMGERSGVDPFDLYSRYSLRIGRPLPEVLKPRAQVDSLDALIDRVRALEEKTDPELFGESLLPFLRRHGLQDMSGELAGRDVDKGLKPFQRKLVREDGLPLDRAMQAAIESGYFPGGETDISDMLDAIDEELAGRPRYATKNVDEQAMQTNDAVQALGQHLGSLGLDVRALSNEEIKKALADASGIEGQIGDVVFEQGDERMIQVDGKWRPVVDSAGHPLARTFAGQLAFWRWFGDSKVVDSEGKPLVMYHGTVSTDIEEFRPGTFFTTNIERANGYTESKSGKTDGGMLYPVYISIKFPLKAQGTEFAAMPGWKGRTPHDVAYNTDGAQETAKKIGYDGVVLYDSLTGDAHMAIPFEPSQVKSAIGNAGTFDPLSGNVLYQPAPDQKWIASLRQVSERNLDHAAKMRTPAPLTVFSITQKTIDAPTRVLLQIAKDHPDVPAVVLERLPELLEDPLFIFPHKAGGIDVVIDVTTEKGEPIVVGIRDGRIRTITPLNDAPTRSGMERLAHNINAALGKLGKVYARSNEALVKTRASAPAPDGANSLEVLSRSRANVITRETLVKRGVVRMSQEFGEGKRGAISFGPDRRFNISLFERANLSTFIHESGHFYLEVFGDVVDDLKARDAATLTDKHRQMIADYDAILRWMGVEGRGAIGVEQHEMWARGIEAYMREGKAPSAELRAVFAKFRAWLVNIYQSLKQLRVELSPEVTAVMDRMFATDGEIDAAARAAEIAPLFADAVSAGMSEEEFAAYRKTVQGASDRAREELQAKLMRQLQREREAWWKKEREAVVAEVAGEIYQRPEYIALSVLQRGTMPDGSALPDGAQPVKLDRAWLVDAYGKEFLKRLPRPYIYAKEGGVNGEIAAGMLGFSSGDEMVMALANAKPMRPMIEAEADARMKERHGDMMLDGSIADVARAAVQNAERSKILEIEMKALRKKQRDVAPFVRQERDRADREAAYAARWAEAERKLAVAIQKGEDQEVIDRLQQELRQIKANTRHGAAMLNSGIPSLETIRAMARGRVAQMMVRDIHPMVYLIAARKAGKAALKAAAGDDFAEALLQKQRELMNVELYRAAVDAQEQVEATADYFRSFDRKGKRERIGKAGGDFLDQIDALLDRFEFKKVSLKVLERRRALSQWIADKEKQGLPVSVPENLVDEARRKNFREMTVEELAGLRDTVKHIEHLAGLKNKLLKARAKRELDEAVADMTQSIRDNAKKRERRIETRLPADEGARLVSGWFASHRKLASYARQMDGFDDGGQVWEYIVRPLNEAADAEAAMKEEATLRLGELFGVYSGKEAAELYRKRHIPEIGASLTKMGRLMVALNWGNEGNRQRVMSGYGWTEKQVEAILATLGEADWTFVQGVWNFIDSYWPAIEAKEKRVDGVAPKKVDRMKFTVTVGGQQSVIDGGYFPIKYDDRQSAKAGADLESEFADIAKRASYVRATTRRGHTEARVEKVELPIRLDFGVIFEHVGQVIHDLTHHEMLIDAGRLLGHKETQAAIYETYGDIVFREFKKALVDVAIGDAAASSAWEKSISHLRQGVSVAYMGWNLMTSLQQPLGLTVSMVRVGPKWVAKGLTRWLRDAASMENTVRWVHDRSDFMRLRHKTQQREISEIRNQVGVESGRLSGWVDEALRAVSADHVTKQGIADSYFWMIAKAQMVADVPTWLGAFEKARAAGETEERAAALADQAVIDSQGGGQIKDLASVQRGGPMLKLWTNFYSIFNVTWNQTVESTRRTNFRDPISIGRLAVDYLLLSVVPATLGALIKHALTGGSDSDDELAKKLAAENLSYLLGMMVGLREIGSAALGYSGYEGPAGARFFAVAGKLAKQTAQGEADAAFWKSLNDSAGILLHYPAGQVRRTIEGFNAMTEGKTANPLALVFGAPKP